MISFEAGRRAVLLLQVRQPGGAAYDGADLSPARRHPRRSMDMFRQPPSSHPGRVACRNRDPKWAVAAQIDPTCATASYGVPVKSLPERGQFAVSGFSLLSCARSRRSRVT